MNTNYINKSDKIAARKKAKYLVDLHQILDCFFKLPDKPAPLLQHFNLTRRAKI